MDYEYKHKEEIVRATQLWECGDITRENLEYIFPELKESEDERIRKSLIEHLQCDIDDMNKSDCPFDFEAEIEELSKYIAWLEKQGQVKESKISQLENKTSEENNNSLTTDDTMIIRIIEALQRYMPTDELLEEQEMVAYLEKQSDTNGTINNDELAQSVLRGAAINLITWIDYNAAEGNMCLSNVQCREIENALVSGNWNKIYAYMKKKLERQDEQKHKDNPLEGILIHGNNDAYRLGYKKAIEKACEWLNNNLLHYWGQINANDTDEFIDNFKKAMEE